MFSLLDPNWGVCMPPLNPLKFKVADELKVEKGLDVENDPKSTATTPESKKQKKKKRKVWKDSEISHNIIIMCPAQLHYGSSDLFFSITIWLPF